MGLTGKSATDKVLDNLKQLTPGSARDIITRAVERLQGNAGTGSVMAIVGLVLAVWSASGYIAAFIRTANRVYDMPEGRPVWKILPLRVALTVVLMVLAVVSALIVVFTGGIAQQAGTALGIGDTALTVWSIAKWPVLVVLVTLMIAILYWASPNAKVKGFRCITPGSSPGPARSGMIASAGFAFYVANFAAYNKPYGSVSRVPFSCSRDRIVVTVVGLGSTPRASRARSEASSAWTWAGVSGVSAAHRAASTAASSSPAGRRSSLASVMGTFLTPRSSTVT